MTREIDLIEEITRAHGYDRFPEDLAPARPTTVPDHPLFQLEDNLRLALSAEGLFEGAEGIVQRVVADQYGQHLVFA